MSSVNLSIDDYKIITTFIRKRNNIYHVYIEYIDYEENKRKQKSIFKSTVKKEAEDQLLEVKYMISKKKIIIPSEISFVDRCLLDIENHESELALRTVISYRTTVNSIFAPFFGDLKLSDIDAFQVESFLKNCENKYASSTLKTIKAILNMFLNTFARTKEIQENPVHYIQKKRTKKTISSFAVKGDNYLEKEDALKFNSYLKGNMFELIFKLILQMGLRPGEASGLTWDNVDLKNKTISINNTLIPVIGGTVLAPPKTLSSIRTLIIPDSLIPLFKDAKLKQNELRLKGLLDKDINFVCLSLRKGPINNNILNYNLCKILNELGIEKKITAHGLRHTYASLIYEQGFDINTISKLLGHASVSTTLNIYTHVFKEIEEKVAKDINILFDNKCK